MFFSRIGLEYTSCTITIFGSVAVQRGVNTSSMDFGRGGETVQDTVHWPPSTGRIWHGTFPIADVQA